jgi:hypothetical protein
MCLVANRFRRAEFWFSPPRHVMEMEMQPERHFAVFGDAAQQTRGRLGPRYLRLEY